MRFSERMVIPPDSCRICAMKWATRKGAAEIPCRSSTICAAWKASL